MRGREGLVVFALLACAGQGGGHGRDGPLAVAEALYLETRTLADQLDVTRARGVDTSIHGATMGRLLAEYRAVRARLLDALSTVDTTALGAEDRRALSVMARTLEESLEENPSLAVSDAGATRDSCRYDPRELLEGPDGAARLTARMFGCYGQAAQTITVDGENLDRLTILGLLGSTNDSSRRRRLFLALEPVWRSVNGDGGPTSPWRLVLARRVQRWTTEGRPHVARARSLGLSPDSVEPWLVRVLEAWHPFKPSLPIEPWDWYYQGGEASRRLGDAIGRDRVLSLNHEHFRALGADPEALNIRYDLEARVGKYPVAYTTFGARPHREKSTWRPGEPWVFASYRIGGLDNLGELLHETGHGVHIAAIRTRPAFADWPDSDTFTEAVADLAAHDLYEPGWQIRRLGDSVPLDISLRAKYAGVMLDVAWSLFEIRLFKDPASSPSEVWAAITSRYFGIQSHPEWSWWAMRGQLVNSPGYMLNYALGAMLVAQLRDRIRAERGDPALGDPGWYPWVANRLFVFGLERPTTRVVADFLGAPLGPEALLRDLARARPHQAH